MVELSPKHIDAAEVVIFIFGVGLTVIVALAIVTQPEVLVPVIEYIVVLSGLTVITDPLSPVLHW